MEAEPANQLSERDKGAYEDNENDTQYNEVHNEEQNEEQNVCSGWDEGHRQIDEPSRERAGAYPLGLGEGGRKEHTEGPGSPAKGKGREGNEGDPKARHPDEG